MHEVEVDAIGAEATQAVLAGSHQVVAARATGVGVARVFASREARFARENDLVSFVRDELAENRLSAALVVHVCAVEQVEACISACGVETRAFITVCISPEAHGSKAELRDAHPCLP